MQAYHEALESLPPAVEPAKDRLSFKDLVAGLRNEPSLSDAVKHQVHPNPNPDPSPSPNPNPNPNHPNPNPNPNPRPATLTLTGLRAGRRVPRPGQGDRLPLYP
eukprot:scaffold135149_cov123-Phaeocystis_antarctica.AAC.2